MTRQVMLLAVLLVAAVVVGALLLRGDAMMPEQMLSDTESNRGALSIDGATEETAPIYRIPVEGVQETDPARTPGESLQIWFVDPEGRPLGNLSAQVFERAGAYSGVFGPREIEVDSMGSASYKPDMRSNEIAVVVLGDKWVSRGSWVNYHSDVPVCVECRACSRHVWGFVRDPNGEALAGATVECCGRTSLTKQDGAYDLLLGAPFDREIRASHDGRVPETKALGALAASPIRLDFELGPCRRVRGRVVRAVDQQPLIGAVLTTGPGYTHGLSDAQGRFLVQLNAEHNVVVVHHRDFLTIQVDLTEFVEAGDEALIEMPSGVGIEIQVATSSGQPIGGAAVRVDWGFDVRVARSDITGRVSLTGLPAGRLVCFATASGYVPSELEVDSEQQGQVLIVLEPGGVLQGRVTSTLGQGLAGALIRRIRTHPRDREVMMGYLPMPAIRCDDEGSFSISDSAEATAVEVSCEGYIRRSFPSVSRHVGPVELRLEPRGELAGVVVDGVTAAPVNRFVVRLFDGVLRSGELPVSGVPSKWYGEQGVHFVATDGRWLVDSNALAVGAVVGVAISADGYQDARFTRVVVGREGSRPEVFSLRPR